ncbi:DnaB-like helicase C-terminal domain-containing protein [Pseudoalteromonas umbrosa]|uniref:DnaB-like helicase C-terminal domain-containing protein n=1 Tax=Pseudoalteromonas umbrosa TaxID=3048489 RepID=UPI0024C43E72|nr:DnaB-like helicase C-terminal domain-containing protein [Pseudoalteromonas sp. B95]MDK1290131.1 DnaB-like helicase C-terminal domain-containing protein [Pseudoalteromonas sp. B95]
MNNKKLSDNMQVNILSLLIFDPEYSSTIHSLIDPNYLDNRVMREICREAQAYINRYKTPPSEHIADLLEDKLKSEKASIKKMYEDILYDLFEQREAINGEFVINSLRSFIRGAHLKKELASAVEHLQKGDIERAELSVHQALRLPDASLDLGMFFGEDLERTLSFLEEMTDCYPTGIPDFDKAGIGPVPKELFIVMAPPNTGKTWCLLNFTKFALLARKKVLHLTLEMHEGRTSQRYLQMLFSISKRNSDVPVVELEKDDEGNLLGIAPGHIERPTLEGNDGIRHDLIKRLKYQKRMPLVIKQFPTGQLTVPMLESYLDQLERHCNFVPDMVVIDYADLMKLDASKMRESLGQLYKDLRGIAVERNLAMVTATQTNRDGADVGVITEKHVAEDFSKIAIADNIISLNQTEAERTLGLMRAYVVKARNDEKGWQVLMTQAYQAGQFVLDSVRMNDSYIEHIETLSGAQMAMNEVD